MIPASKHETVSCRNFYKNHFVSSIYLKTFKNYKGLLALSQGKWLI